ncbi:MAG: glycosyltransferase [Verrucomicrobiaceae bacterium]|nr:glycosyltransferase [Verrucomicrobiaceae bacterium]
MNRDPMDPNLVLLFYRMHQYDYVETYSRRSISGFQAWFESIRSGLTKLGLDVRVNDYELASQHPEQPVGIVGTPDILPDWTLPNPAILGPSMLDNPRIAPNLMQRPGFEKYIVTCEWMLDIFKPFYGDKCLNWHAGINTVLWPDASGDEKHYDALIYNKIRWGKDFVAPLVLPRLTGHLEKRSLSYKIVEYGQHTHDEYRELLKQSRFMIFLCEHETQGLAYQEAMSMNLPVFAWNPGYWTDPVWSVYCEDVPKATSVPQFDSRCGHTFKFTCDLEAHLDKFLEQLPSFKPRQFILEECELITQARKYLLHYQAIS